MGRSRTQANVHDILSTGLDVLEFVTVGRDSIREELCQTSVDESMNGRGKPIEETETLISF